MYVSLDGASRETYDRYRIGGDFDRVLKNVRLLADAKVAAGSNRPRLIWKLVVFDYNQHEVEIVQRTYKQLGFDDCEFVPDWLGETYKRKNHEFNARLIQEKGACYFPWNAMVITWQGDVKACCHGGREFELGNAMKDGVRQVWRSVPYQELRSGFATKTFGINMHAECKKCLEYVEPVKVGHSARPLQIGTKVGPQYSSPGVDRTVTRRPAC